jgi:hypothetical protein
MGGALGGLLFQQIIQRQVRREIIESRTERDDG